MDSEQKPKASIESMVDEVTHSPQLLELRRRNIMRFVYQRMIAGPGGSIVFHAILIVLMLKLATGTSTDAIRSNAVTIIEPKTVELPENKIEDILKDIEQKPPEVPENPIEDITRPVLNDQTAIGESVSSDAQGSDANTTGLGSGEGTDQGFEISVVRSPVVIKGLYASRTAGGRRAALAKFGGGGGVAEGVTETAVLRALRWLKKNQQPNGSWTQSTDGSPGDVAGPPAAMTGFALLAFLAHGETPGSDEFGDTVERAIKWLIQNQKPTGRFNGSDGNEYSLPIASYALCEAYSLTKIPMIKEAATKSTEVLIKGQNTIGLLWNYRSVGGSDRNDMSYAAWCMQALKAAKMAGLENPGLNDCIKKSIEGLRLNFRPTSSGEAGGFSYTTGGGPGNLTGAGVLCMQLLGVPNDKKVTAGLAFIEPMTCDWQNPFAGGPLYYWYYATQAKFQAGGSTWNRWNKQFWPQFVKNQIVIPKGIADKKGNLMDIGYWQTPGKSEHCKSYIYSTALCTLTLEVYYRYLPTYHAAETTSTDATLTVENGVKVDIR